MLPNVRNLLVRWVRGPLPTWHHPDYRMPLPSIEARSGAEPRRADYVAWHLVATGALKPRDLLSPPLATWHELSRAHEDSLLRTLDDPEVLARIYGTDPAEIMVDEVLRTVRLACGGTIAAARAALAEGRATVNLLGGFHHAGPDRAGGSCAVNDIAVAVAALRDAGFDHRVSVIDLDAHPPDGTAACLARDHSSWIGSISGSNWVALPDVDETVLPPGSGDELYLETLDALLARRPESGLVFVLAGGDVLRGDRLGQLGLSLEGALERDARVLASLGRTPSVWLPAGGYHPDAWRLFAGTANLLATGRKEFVPKGPDPLRGQFAGIAAGLDAQKLGDDEWITTADLEGTLSHRETEPRLLGHYTASGVEYAMYRYGVLTQLQRLGYRNVRVRLDRGEIGDRMRIYGTAGGLEHLLTETVLARDRVDGKPVLLIHWMTLRNPRALFSTDRPRLRGQEVPGLGMAREAGELLSRVALRLGLAGVAFRPMHLHSAWTGRHEFHFVEAPRQARFEALMRDARGRPLPVIDAALDEGRVLLDGAPYRWEPDMMVSWLASEGPDQATVEKNKEGMRFHFVEAAASAAVHEARPG
ncbi:MAG: histone deacetylase [Pseudomonadota bacterium]|nr:histone deacetylase [Pseudomonadota bacterium]